MFRDPSTQALYNLDRERQAYQLRLLQRAEQTVEFGAALQLAQVLGIR